MKIICNFNFKPIEFDGFKKQAGLVYASEAVMRRDVTLYGFDQIMAHLIYKELLKQ
jgi:hypothetical protein